jgi:exodeoxyribonuclease III
MSAAASGTAAAAAPAAAAASPPPLRLLCWNVNGLLPTLANAALLYSSWPAFFAAWRLDLACLQEAKLPLDKVPRAAALVPGFQSFWACSGEKKGYSGAVTYAAERWAPAAAALDALPEPEGDSGEGRVGGEGRVVETSHCGFVLMNVYVPNAGGAAAGRPRLPHKLRFLRALEARADALAAAGREVLLVGDFNLAAAEADVSPAIGGLAGCYSAEERAWLATFIGKFGDVWRKLHPDAKEVYTCWDVKTSRRAFNEGLRIDYALATPGLLARITKCEVLPADAAGRAGLPSAWSDHAALLLEMDLKPPPAPPPPSAAWRAMKARFVDPAQRSIRAMFGAAAAAGAKRKRGDGAAGAAGAAEPAAQRPKAAAAAAEQRPAAAPPPAAPPGGKAKGIAAFFAATPPPP